MQLEEVDLTTWIGRTETVADTVDRDARRRADRHAGPPCRTGAGRHSAAAAVALALLPAAAPAVGDRAGRARQAAAASCRRWRCRGACGPAAVRLPPPDPGRRRGRAYLDDRRRHEQGRPHRALVFVTSATRSAQRRDRAGAGRVPRHRLPRGAAARTRPRRRRTRRRPGATWQREIVPDDVLLFRYSALTFNGHRIHYDRRYVTEVEGYPGLIVHGPLLATLLLDLVRRNAPDAEVTTLPLPGRAPDVRPAPVPGQRRAPAPTARPCSSGPRTTKAS